MRIHTKTNSLLKHRAPHRLKLRLAGLNESTLRGLGEHPEAWQQSPKAGGTTSTHLPLAKESKIVAGHTQGRGGEWDGG